MRTCGERERSGCASTGVAIVEKGAVHLCMIGRLSISSIPVSLTDPADRSSVAKI
jgi:hypothetical protein